MTEPHRHDPETGEVVIVEVEPPENAEANAIRAAAEADAAARVEQARIEGETVIELAKIEKTSEATEEQNELEALRIEVASLRDQLAPPEPTPVPIIMDNPEPGPEPEADSLPAPPPIEDGDESEKPKKKAGLGMW